MYCDCRAACFCVVCVFCMVLLCEDVCVVLSNACMRVYCVLCEMSAVCLLCRLCVVGSGRVGLRVTLLMEGVKCATSCGCFA